MVEEEEEDLLKLVVDRILDTEVLKVYEAILLVEKVKKDEKYIK
jgi:hypothetical protein